MCSFTKKLQLWGTLSPRPPTRASPLDPTSELMSCRPPNLLLCPPSNPVRSMPLWHDFLHHLINKVSQRITLSECSKFPLE